MKTILVIAIAVGLYFIFRNLSSGISVSKRRSYIDSYTFPRTLAQRLRSKYPHLTDAEASEVVEGLRDYFHICNAAGKSMVFMPSQVVDVVWREFIFFTLQYQKFCKNAFGRFLHQVPAEAMKTPTAAQKGIRLAWGLACQRERISLVKPHCLPLLFARDGRLNIPDGFTYQLNGQRQARAPGSCSGGCCASHIGCSSSSDEGGSSAGGCSSSSGCGGD